MRENHNGCDLNKKIESQKHVKDYNRTSKTNSSMPQSREVGTKVENIAKHQEQTQW